jgi:hypothetical protein
MIGQEKSGAFFDHLQLIGNQVNDLANILEESDIAQRKGFLRSFVKKIVIDKDKAILYYKAPMPPDSRRIETVGILPIVTPSGAEVSIGRTVRDFDLTFSLSP